MREFLSQLMVFWSPAELSANITIFLNLTGALVLGCFVGYERSYHGRAAGMRTYGLVCMASAALVVLVGYPEFWFGGKVLTPSAADPTRVMQGVVTGIGFLGAGVIMKEGFSISGLTTAASIWASSAIGILIGVGFYAAAILLALLSAGCMVLVYRLEMWLPTQSAIAITLRFKKGYQPKEAALVAMAKERGYVLMTRTLCISNNEHGHEWRFVAVAENKHAAKSISELSLDIEKVEGVESFQLAHAKN
ncbi:MgtC/SapB family protein [Undibacterium sp. SXout20W]|uniref:MgtC/SapB family protein n=1 Tax=Undibacterium sp. SXout20W TaxID=3413051 RepID=UPI003BEF9076